MSDLADRLETDGGTCRETFQEVMEAVFTLARGSRWPPIIADRLNEYWKDRKEAAQRLRKLEAVRDTGMRFVRTSEPKDWVAFNEALAACGDENIDIEAMNKTSVREEVAKHGYYVQDGKVLDNE